MKKDVLLLVLVLSCTAVLGEEPRRGEAGAERSFPLDLAIVNPESSDQRPPYLVMFQDGRDHKGNDASKAVGRLKALRGASKLFPESNEDPGLPVVLRGLRLHQRRRPDGSVAGFDVELQGEFNSVKVPLNLDEAKRFLAGERTTFSLKGEKNYGVYSYVSTIEMEVELRGDEIFIFAIDGDFRFREGFYSYTSKPARPRPSSGRKYLYRGSVSELPDLPYL
jgi:hypothetical protein